jgi:hypothetical protein
MCSAGRLLRRRREGMCCPETSECYDCYGEARRTLTAAVISILQAAGACEDFGRRLGQQNPSPALPRHRDRGQAHIGATRTPRFRLPSPKCKSSPTSDAKRPERKNLLTSASAAQIVE